MRKHLNIKEKCIRKNITCTLSNEELDNLSLKKNLDSGDDFTSFDTILKDDPGLEHLKVNHLDEICCAITSCAITSCEEQNTEDELFCKYCSKKFSRKYNLKIHLEDNRCKKKKDVEISNAQNNTNYIYNTINNTNNTTNNIMVNIIMNPFESKFDTSHIDDLTKMDLIINILFTKALEHILENKNNLNLLIEDNNESAIVYKNDIDKFVRMKKEDFTHSIMKNMKDVLSDMNDEIQKNPYLTKRIDEIIDLKYNNYIEEKKTNEMVNDMICKIYDQKKMEIQELFKNANNNEDVIIY
jgi:hypothetical protein